MNEEEANSLRNNYCSIIKSIDVEDVLPKLFQENLISQNTYERIKNIGVTRQDKAEELMTVLLKCDNPKAYSTFISTLQEENYEYLANSIQEKVSSIRRSKRVLQRTTPVDEETAIKGRPCSSSNELDKKKSMEAGKRLSNQMTDEHRPGLPEMNTDVQEKFSNIKLDQLSTETPHKVVGNFSLPSHDEVSEDLDVIPNEKIDQTLVKASMTNPILNKKGLEGSYDTPDGQINKYNQSTFITKPSLTPLNNLTNPIQALKTIENKVACTINPTLISPKNYDVSFSPQSEDKASNNLSLQNISLQRNSLNDTFGFKFITAKGRPRHKGDNDYYVTHILNDTIAANSRLKVNDTIISINGHLIKDFSYDEVVNLFRKELMVHISVVPYIPDVNY